MKKVALFYDGGRYTILWYKALLWAKEQFRELGYEMDFLSDEEYVRGKNKVETFEKYAFSSEYDIAFIAHSPWKIGLCSIEYEKFVAYMKRLRNHCDKIIWFDTEDSSGMLWPKAFPYVDLYFKKQTLKDTNQYLTKMWGGRLYTEYYHKNGYLSNISKEAEAEGSAVDRGLPTKEELKKMRSAWNYGICDCFGAMAQYTYAFPNVLYNPPAIEPSLERKYDIHFKGTMDYTYCGTQRSKTVEMLEKMDLQHTKLGDAVPLDEYWREIFASKSVVSPFGWGEICFRDFEAMIFGATLLKPDMSHIDTWPNWYLPNETYVPINWDFSNFVEVVEKTKSSKEYIQIAKNAQNMFLHYRYTDEGKMEFAKHIIEELERPCE